MRLAPWVLVGLLAVLLVPSGATAQGIELFSGQKVKASIEDEGEAHIFRFRAIEGDVVTIKFSVKSSSDLEPIVSLIGPDGDIDLPAAVNGKFKLDKLAIPASGIHILTVYGAGTTGAYKISFTHDPVEVEPVTRTLPDTFTVMLPAGAKVTFKVKAEKGSDLHPGIDRLVDPMGNDILDQGILKEKEKKASLEVADCPLFGLYTVHLAPRQGTGNAVIKTKIKPAKAPVSKLTNANAVDCLVAMVRYPDGFGGYDYEINAEAFGGNVASATVRFPAGSGLGDQPLTDDDGDLRYTGEGLFPDGLYILFVTDTSGKTLEHRFQLGGDWPTALDVTVQNGSTATPQISWTGGTGGFFFVLEVSEYDAGEDEWNGAYGFFLSADSTSHAVPDGPLDAVPHEVQIFAISQGLKATAARSEL